MAQLYPIGLSKISKDVYVEDKPRILWDKVRIERNRIWNSEISEDGSDLPPRLTVE